MLIVSEYVAFMVNAKHQTNILGMLMNYLFHMDGDLNVLVISQPSMIFNSIINCRTDDMMLLKSSSSTFSSVRSSFSLLMTKLRSLDFSQFSKYAVADLCEVITECIKNAKQHCLQTSLEIEQTIKKRDTIPKLLVKFFDQQESKVLHQQLLDIRFLEESVILPSIGFITKLASVVDISDNAHPLDLMVSHHIGGDNNECIICCCEPRTVVFPCGHMICCEECAKLLSQMQHQCPLCKRAFENHQIIRPKFFRRSKYDSVVHTTKTIEDFQQAMDTQTDMMEEEIF
eukprot:gnl/Carplike_NY0171/10544_a14878_155.p1 GENE.gnl/Carplike_NY0171/10544_a14878_155~~gnl/Carplike_NY0171/10544_a14878_155.p1  ORF type:complete len:320 (-),score=52.96 gnl/Carplike_NY0171/10544_a14878_155:99-956(-)